MNRDAQLESVTNIGGLYTLTDAAPKSCIEQDDVNSRVENVRRKLFKIYNDGIRSKRHAHFFTDATHTAETVNRIFQVIVVDVFDLLSKPDRLLGRPNGVRIESKAVAATRSASELFCQSPIAFELINRIEDTAFHFVGREAMFRLELFRVSDELIDGPHLAASVYRARVSEKEIRSERHFVIQFAAEDIVDRNIPFLSKDI